MRPRVVIRSTLAVLLLTLAYFLLNNANKHNHTTESEISLQNLYKNSASNVISNSKKQHIIFNRMPKCGSSTLNDLIAGLSHRHNFTFFRSVVYMKFHIPSNELFELTQRLSSVKNNMLYERHIHFVDFTRFGKLQPTYINIVRDPLDRLASWYYYKRFQQGHRRNMPLEDRIRSFDECVLTNQSECTEPQGDKAEAGYFKMIPFFCGQDEYCRKPTTRALVQAMHNVKHHYALVGLLDSFPDVLRALEHLLPTFFDGVVDLYKQAGEALRAKYRTTHVLPISDVVRAKMKPLLELEYRFYDFVRARFVHQLRDIGIEPLQQ